MTKEEYITKIEDLLKQEQFGEIIEAYNETCKKFIKESKRLRKQLLEAHIEKGEDESSFEAPADKLDNRFRELQAIFAEKNKTYQEQLRQQLSENLEIKQAIIEDLKKLVAEEDRIGAAFKKFNDLREKWRTTGDVPSEAYKELQAEYSKQIEIFFYNINIYKDLKEYDFKKNLELKNEVIRKIEELIELQSIRKTEYLIRAYQTEWDEIGPTFQQDWKEVRDKYWEAIRQVYQKINSHYEQVRSLHLKHQEQKLDLISKAKDLAGMEISDHKRWQEKTQTIIQLQKEWKKTGFTFKTENEKLWEEFRSACDAFFQKKKQFYESHKEQLSAIKEKKQALIEEARALSGETQWRETTEKFKHLQQAWKESGHVDQRAENQLWKQFKAACDVFFTAKRNYYDTLDERREENLKKKEALIREIQNFEATGNKEEALKLIKSFTLRWKEIDQIPRKERDRVNKEYNQAIDEIYSQMKIAKDEKEQLKYKNKIEGMKQLQNSNEMLRKERLFLKDKINRLESDILKLEENLGFFKNSNHEHPLKQDIEKKISLAKSKVDGFKSKLELVLNAKTVNE